VLSTAVLPPNECECSGPSECHLSDGVMILTALACEECAKISSECVSVLRNELPWLEGSLFALR
jgi:hypothetical protein